MKRLLGNDKATTPSEDCFNLVKTFEGLRLKAYYCPAGILTIGYGHTGKDVTRGMVITKSTAEKLLWKDIRKASYFVDKYVKVDLTQGQYDALTSFVFNLGAGSFKASTLLKVINRGEYDKAPKQLLRWVYGGGRRLRGLELRRKAEVDLFMS